MVQITKLRNNAYGQNIRGQSLDGTKMGSDDIKNNNVEEIKQCYFNNAIVSQKQRSQSIPTAAEQSQHKNQQISSVVRSVQQDQYQKAAPSIPVKGSATERPKLVLRGQKMKAEEAKKLEPQQSQERLQIKLTLRTLKNQRQQIRKNQYQQTTSQQQDQQSNSQMQISSVQDTGGYQSLTPRIFKDNDKSRTEALNSAEGSKNSNFQKVKIRQSQETNETLLALSDEKDNRHQSDTKKHRRVVMKNQISLNEAQYHKGVQLKQKIRSPMVIDDMSVQRKNMLEEIGSLISQTSTPMQLESIIAPTFIDKRVSQNSSGNITPEKIHIIDHEKSPKVLTSQSSDPNFKSLKLQSMQIISKVQSSRKNSVRMTGLSPGRRDKKSSNLDIEMELNEQIINKNQSSMSRIDRHRGASSIQKSNQSKEVSARGPSASRLNQAFQLKQKNEDQSTKNNSNQQENHSASVTTLTLTNQKLVKNQSTLISGKPFYINFDQSLTRNYNKNPTGMLNPSSYRNHQIYHNTKHANNLGSSLSSNNHMESDNLVNSRPSSMSKIDLQVPNLVYQTQRNKKIASQRNLKTIQRNGQYEAKSELMGFIKSQRGNITEDHRSASESIVNSRTSRVVTLPKGNVLSQDEQLVQTEASYNHQAAMIDYEATKQLFSKHNPMKQTRLKNNRRLFESLLKEPAQKRLKLRIAQYTDEKTPFSRSQQTQQESSNENFQISTTQQSVTKVKSGTISANPYRSIPTKDYYQQSVIKDTISEKLNDLENHSVTTAPEQSTIQAVLQERFPIDFRNKSSSYESIQSLAEQDQKAQSSMQSPPKRVSRKQSVQPRQNKKSRQQSLQVVANSMLVTATYNDQQPIPIAEVNRVRIQPQRSVSEEQIQQKANEGQIKVNQMKNAFNRFDIPILRLPVILEDSVYTNVRHREFIHEQPEKLRQMVMSKSKAALQQSQKIKDDISSRSIDDQKSTLAAESSQQHNYVEQNKLELAKSQFMKDKVKRYCEDSGMPSHEHVKEYQRLQFLQEISKDIKPMNLEREDQKDLQLLRLKAIEETPFSVPLSDVQQKQLDSSVEKISFRQPKIKDDSFEDDQAALNESQVLVQKNLQTRMDQIANILGEMKMPKSSQSIFDINQEQKNDIIDEQDEIQEDDTQQSQSQKSIYQAAVKEPESDMTVILKQKQMIKEYVQKIHDFDKRHHREYWERIKRVHAKLDVKIKEQRFLEDLQDQIVREKIQADEVKKKKMNQIKRRNNVKTTLELAQAARGLKRMRMDYHRKHGKKWQEEDNESFISEKTDKDEDFNNMRKKVQKRVGKHKLLKRINRLIEFQRELVTEFDKIQLEQFQEAEDDKEIDIETITEQQLRELMNRRFDRQLSQIFLKTELFFEYHQELDMNFELLNAQMVTKDVADNTKQKVEDRLRVQVKEIIPSLMNTAKVISANSQSPRSALQSESKSRSTMDAFNELRQQLKMQVQKRVLTKQPTQVTYDQHSIIEKSSETSSNSSYLNSDDSQGDQDKSQKLVLNLKNKKKINFESSIVVRKLIQTSSEWQSNPENIKRQESAHISMQTSSFHSSHDQTSSSQNELSKEQSKQSSLKGINEDAVSNQNFQDLQNKLNGTARQESRRESGISIFRDQQSVLVEAFSKALATNLTKSVEDNEKLYQKQLAKQLVRKAQFGNGFKLQSAKKYDDQKAGDIDEDSLEETIKQFQMRKQLMDERKQNFIDKQVVKKQSEKSHGNIHEESQESSIFEMSQSDVQSIKTIQTKDALKQVEEDREKRQAEQTDFTKILGSQVMAIAKEALVEQSTSILKEAVQDQESVADVKDRVKRMLANDMSTRKEKLPEEQQQLLKEAKKMQKNNQKAKYINNVIKSGRLPLPLLNKIQNKFLFLQDYHLEDKNFKMLCQALPHFVPNSLTKIALMNNQLQDSDCANMFKILETLAVGPKVIGLINNMNGIETLKAVANYMTSSAAGGLTKLIFKDQIWPNNKKPYTSEFLTRDLVENGRYMYRLKQLVLQNVGLNKKDLLKISELTSVVQSLKQLNISSNGLKMADFEVMFDVMHPQVYHLTHLNLSWNSFSNEGISFEKGEQITKKFAGFLRHTRTLQHLDLSGIGISEANLKYLTLYGFRKSKTLLCLHMNSNFESHERLLQFREWMKVVSLQRKVSRDRPETPKDEDADDVLGNSAEPQLENSQEEQKTQTPQENISLKEAEKNLKRKNHTIKFSSTDEKIREYNPFQHRTAKNLLKDEYMETMRDYNTKKLNQNGPAQRFSKAMKKGGFQANIIDRIVFQRFLGHYEIINGYRWHEVDETDCFLCNNWAYCVFLTDRRLAYDEDIYHTVSTKKIGNVRPKSIFAPTYCSLDSIQQILPMIPIQAFLSRMSANKNYGGMQRTLKDHDIEDQEVELTKKVEQFDQKQQKRIKLQEHSSEILIAGKQIKWHTLLQRYISSVIHGNPPQGTVSHNNLPQLYQLSQRDESLMICATYIPPQMTSVIIQDQTQSTSQVNFTEIFPQKFKRIPRKNTRKVQEVRKFSKENSVFKEFKEENEDLMRRQLRYDAALNKIPRFIKDQEELDRVYDVMLKYYRPLRDQFFSQISRADAYPVIDWIEFTTYCQIWNVIGSGLKTSDVDRIFIATNVELEDQEANDDRSLCRFEFFEIITRMAKTKYFESKVVGSISEALEKILLDHILPHAQMRFESVEWRKTFLYTLEVDDLYRANLDMIKRVFNLAKKGSQKFIKHKDLMSVIQGYPLNVSMDTVTLAFAFSKMQFVEELEQIENYEKLFFVEFLEFIGRLSFLIYEGTDEGLDSKIWRLLQILFGKFNEQVKDPLVADDIDSESDYEDELACQILAQKHPQEPYAGFGMYKKYGEETDGGQLARMATNKAIHYHANPFSSRLHTKH